MDFFDNVVNKSNALIKERLNNPFSGIGTNKQQQTGQESTAPSTSSDKNQQLPQQNLQSQQQSNSAPDHKLDSDTIADVNATDQGIGDKNQFATMAADAEAVAQKAAQGAKNFGNFLFSMANKAGQTVTQTAKQVKQVVENTSIMTNFTREQQEFIKEHGGALQTGDLPWSDCSDESRVTYVREQILSLSQDKRNFVRSPPADSEFKFDSQQCYPIALSLLREDPNLSKMRYELVPKLVNEDSFWRNYFYRVSMLKQMSEKGELSKQGWSRSRSSSGEGPDERADGGSIDVAPQIDSSKFTSSQPQLTAGQKQLNLGLNTGGSSTIKLQDDLSESQKILEEADDLKSKLKELNIGSFDLDEDPSWDEDLQQELQEYELVSGGDISNLDEAELEEELLEMKKTD